MEEAKSIISDPSKHPIDKIREIVRSDWIDKTRDRIGYKCLQTNDISDEDIEAYENLVNGIW